MISGILSNILGYILIIGFILGFLGGSIYLIIYGVREYLAEKNWVWLSLTVFGCISVMAVIILILKAFGL